MWIKIAPIIAALTLLFPTHVLSQSLSAKIVRVIDGDTIEVNYSNANYTVRLACIDAPEKDQPVGSTSTKRLNQLLPKDSNISINIVENNVNNRILADIYKNNLLINVVMVQEGQAVVYDDARCGLNAQKLLEAQNTAKQRKLGFWLQSDPILPWEWRQGKRTNNFDFTNFPTSQPSSTLPACVNRDCDCRDFKTQAEAQRVFNSYSYDKFKLDSDGDGKVCEDMP